MVAEKPLPIVTPEMPQALSGVQRPHRKSVP